MESDDEEDSFDHTVPPWAHEGPRESHSHKHDRDQHHHTSENSVHTETWPPYCDDKSLYETKFNDTWTAVKLFKLIGKTPTGKEQLMREAKYEAVALRKAISEHIITLEGFSPKVVHAGAEWVALVMPAMATDLSVVIHSPQDLPAIAVQELLMGPSERYNILVDFSDLPVGSEILLKNIGPDGPLMKLDMVEAADTATTGQVVPICILLRETEIHQGHGQLKLMLGTEGSPMNWDGYCLPLDFLQASDVF
ncbi:hypothetical protein Pelo_6440 [Pelomyxa schiedti]|nr:hypothetical protein Pelo_6440 [Pelomyxa schiedti]